MTATTITIFRKTYRDSACANTEDLAVFDAEADRIFAAIAKDATENGMVIKVSDGSSHGPSYTVSAEDYNSEQAAHDFMQSPAADFWSKL